MSKHSVNNKQNKKLLFFIICSIFILITSFILINNKKLIKQEDKNIILNKYMSELTEKLMNENDENMISTKYLITDNTIERIRENTSVSTFKNEIGNNIKIYTDDTCKEEVTDGIIKSSMVAVDDENNMYYLIVYGDVNKDGKVNEVDISKIVRKEIKDEISEKASKFGTDNIVNKIVFGKYEFEPIPEVLAPEIQVIDGSLGENEWYTSSIKLKIIAKEKNQLKTVYKIKGTKETPITQIEENDTIELTKDGVYKIVAYTYGKEGNRSRIAQKIIKINTTGIEAIINYTPEQDTTDSVIAKVSFNKEGITITNNDGKDTYEFLENGQFTFEYIDEAGRKGSITASVSWIKPKEITGQDGEWKYFINKDGTIQLTQYLGSKTELVVPAQYDGYTVYAVGNANAKDDKETRLNVLGNTSDTTIEKLTIENGIKQIKKAAFNGCTGINGKLVIPDSVTNIDDYVFSSCTGITGDLIIPDSVTNVGRAAFQNCPGLNGNLKISKNITEIADYVFNGCKNLTGPLVFPPNIKSIGRTSFQNCSKLSGNLTIPSTVESIGPFAFFNCKGFTGDLVIPNSVTSMGKKAFQNCSGFNGKLVLSENLTAIEEYTFYQCSNLTENLHFPDGITSIGKYAFNGCSKLTGDLVIPAGVTTIEAGTFQLCKNLNGTLTLPDTLTSIGAYAFNQCNSLTGNLIIPDSVEIIDDVSFQSLSKMTGKLVLPKNVKKIGKFAFYDDKFTGELTLPEGLEILGEAAFGKNTGFENTKIVIPSTLKQIGIDYEFDGENLGLSTHDFYNFGAINKKFESFEVSPGNQYFESIDGVLYTKNRKRLVSYPRNKKDLSYEIIEGVKTLDELSIASNSILKTLTIPDSLSVEIRSQYIRMEGCNVLTAALYSYNEINNIVAKETNPNYKSVDGVLYTKNLKELVYISSGRTSQVIIPDGVEKIREDAIFGNQVYYVKIAKVYIPSSLTDIPDSQIKLLNSSAKIVEVSPENPKFTVDANNKLIKK